MEDLTNIVINIKIGKHKRSWEAFRKIVNKETRYHLDLRTASKNNIPLFAKSDCCGSELKVMKKKDFPLKDKKCKCGKSYLIKWA